MKLKLHKGKNQSKKGLSSLMLGKYKLIRSQVILRRKLAQ